MTSNRTRTTNSGRGAFHLHLTVVSYSLAGFLYKPRRVLPSPSSHCLASAQRGALIARAGRPGAALSLLGLVTGSGPRGHIRAAPGHRRQWRPCFCRSRGPRTLLPTRCLCLWVGEQWQRGTPAGGPRCPPLVQPVRSNWPESGADFPLKPPVPICGARCLLIDNQSRYKIKKDINWQPSL